MLEAKESIGTLAVRDLSSARKFYEGILGLKVVDAQGSEAITFQSGASKILVYRSQYAGTNKATALNWLVGKDIETIAHGLKERGVAFERYEFPGVIHEGDLHVMAGFKTAWFKDPDGNILCLMDR